MIVRRLLLIVASLLYIFAATCATHKLKLEDSGARPWKNNEQKLRVMLKMTSQLTDSPPASNRCLERVKKWLNLAGKKDTTRNHSMVTIGSSEEPDECAAALVSCGNCHLPRTNNCTYTVEYYSGAEKKTSTGTVVSINDRGVTVGELHFEEERRHSESMNVTEVAIRSEDIVNSKWLSGADAPEKWWDFKRFSGRGETAHKMFDLATRAGVKCTHCHVEHGDFRLNHQGEKFLKTGKVN